MLRTHMAGELRKENIGQDVRLSGWVDTIRDHGGVKFIDLRDQSGKTQIVLHDEAMLEGVNRETVVSAYGKVRARGDESINPKLDTGYIEVFADKLEILGKCRNMLPFEIDDSTSTREEVRLAYRYLDLRNPAIHNNIVLRARIISYIRRQMEEMGFLEMQTPILTASSPEGARDYLVPSRVKPGKFYALPQSPQIFKQLLMVSGYERYFQIAKCFRDEDLRADRQPEFTQIDIEMSFAGERDIMRLVDEMLARVMPLIGQKYPDRRRRIF